jgi:hypothetical protein
MIAAVLIGRCPSICGAIAIQPPGLRPPAGCGNPAQTRRPSRAPATGPAGLLPWAIPARYAGLAYARSPGIARAVFTSYMEPLQTPVARLGATGGGAMRRTSPLMRGPDHPLTCDGRPGGCPDLGCLFTRRTLPAHQVSPCPGADPGLPGHARTARTAGDPLTAGWMDRRT